MDVKQATDKGPKLQFKDRAEGLCAALQPPSPAPIEQGSCPHACCRQGQPIDKIYIYVKVLKVITTSSVISSHAFNSMCDHPYDRSCFFTQGNKVSECLLNTEHHIKGTNLRLSSYWQLIIQLRGSRHLQREHPK